MIFRKHSKQKDSTETTPTPPGQQDHSDRLSWRNAFRLDSLLLYSFSAVVLIVTALVFWNYYTPEWKDWYPGFRALMTGGHREIFSIVE